jgi:DNA polymerase-3 subunit gamma/tau
MQSVDYKAIARRFRPKAFSEVTGQDPIVATLKNALIHDKVSHAYLFCGTRGTGKTTLARLFAKAINCEKITPEGEPCNVCSSCIEIAKGASLDVIEIDGASNRGIDDIRGINETLPYATFQGKYKIYLIDEVHMLTKEAFNALLKSLEEPPKNVKFFFATTEPQKVLPTILSRCQRFDLTRIRPFEIIKKLRSIAKEINVEIEDEALGLIAKLAEGSLRDAESLLDQVLCSNDSPITKATIVASLCLMGQEHFFALDEAYKKGDLSFAFDLAQDLFNNGKEVSHIIDGLLEHYRNIASIFVKKKEPETAFSSQDEIDGYKRASVVYTLEKILYLIEYLSDLQLQNGKVTFKKIHLEMILFRIIQSKNRVSIDEIVKRLSEIEGQEPPQPFPEVIKEIPVQLVEPLKQELSNVEAPLKAVTTVEKIEQPKAVPPPVKIQAAKSTEEKEKAVRRETLMHFAQVELGGSLKKGSV